MATTPRCPQCPPDQQCWRCNWAVAESGLKATPEALVDEHTSPTRIERLGASLFGKARGKARGVDVVSDSTTDQQLDEMRAAGRLVTRASDPPADFDG